MSKTGYDKIIWTRFFLRMGKIDEAEVTLDDNNPIPSASYEDNEEWVEQFGTESSFY